MTGRTSRKSTAIVLFLREIAAFLRFFLKTTKTEKALVFYAEHRDYYPIFEGIIEKLMVGYDQGLCYVTSDPGDPVLKKTEKKIKSFYLKKLLSFFMAVVNCRVFVMTLTDLNNFHLKRSINPVHYVYVFHSPVSTHVVYRKGAFDHYDSILCVGPHQVKEIRRHEELNNIPPKKLVEAGYDRLEQIYWAYQKYQLSGSRRSGKGTVLVAPSWGPDNVLESCGERLVSILLESGYNVIVRPHPETVKRFPAIMDQFNSKFGGNPNFTLEGSIATFDSMLKADVLISDWSGIAIEYAFGTERPVLFLDVPMKVNNQEFEELEIEPLELVLREEIGVIISSEKLETVPQVISRLMSDRLSYREHIVEFREKNIYSFEHSSEIGSRYIVDLVNDGIQQ